VITVVRVRVLPPSYQRHLGPQTIAIAISTGVYSRLTGVGNVGGIVGNSYPRYPSASVKGILQVLPSADLSSLLSDLPIASFYGASCVNDGG